MKIDIKKWMSDFHARILAAFKERLIFLGLQGSHGRGEQTSTSDIDVVVILDKVEFADLQSYRSIINRMECRDLVCGFVAGMPELLAWEKYDLLQLYLDTVPYFGSLDFLKEHFNKEDIKRAVRVGACNVYHAASHNFLHARDMVALKDIYKAARFVARMKYYLDTGIYNTKIFSDMENVALPEAWYEASAVTGEIRYISPGAAAYAEFYELADIVKVRITVDVPAGQDLVGISEIRILAK